MSLQDGQFGVRELTRCFQRDCTFPLRIESPCVRRPRLQWGMRRGTWW